MPDLSHITAAARLLNPTMLITSLVYLAVFACLIVYFDGYCRAMAPRAGTLEWIYLYDRPRFSLPAGRRGLARCDWLPVLLFGSAAAGFTAYGIVQLAAHPPADPFAILLSPDKLLTGTAGYALYLGLSALPAYCLFKTLTGRRAIAIAGTAVFLLNLIPGSFAPSLSVPLLLLSAIFFCRFMTQDPDAGFFRTLPSLFFWLLFFWAAVWCEHTALWFGTGYAVLLIVTFVFRLRDRCRRGGIVQPLLTLLAIAVFTALFAALICIPAAVSERSMAFPQALSLPDFWRFVLARTISFHILIDLEGILAISMLNPLLWWGGLLAAIPVLLSVFSRRDVRALLTAVFYLSGTLVWVFAGSGIGAAAATCTLCYIWQGFLGRGKPLAFLLYALVCAVLALAMTAMPLLLILL